MAKNADPPDQHKTKEQLIRALNLLRSELADLSQKPIHPRTRKLDPPVGETENAKGSNRRLRRKRRSTAHYSKIWFKERFASARTV
jgi:hypothetical protein